MKVMGVSLPWRVVLNQILDKIAVLNILWLMQFLQEGKVFEK